MAKTKPNRPSKAPKEPSFNGDKARTKYQRELIAKARDFYKDKNLGDGVSGEKYFNSLNDEQKIKAGELLQFRENNFDVLGFTKDGLGERSPLFGKRFNDEQFIKMFDRDKGFYGPGLREGDTGEDYMFRPGNEPALDFYAEGKLGYVYRPDDPRIFDYLGFPKGAKIQDQTDEKGRMKMQEGGTVDDTRLGNVLTPEEYQSRFIDFYAAPQIQVEAAPEPEDKEDEQEPVRPNILMPVGQRDEQVANVFGQIPVVGTGQQISTEDPYEYIRNFDTQEKNDLSGKGFSRYLEQAAGVPGAVVTMATGLPISALAYGAGQLARKQHRKNAESIASYGGNAGSMFKFQGQTVSRAPGSKIFTGNLGGLSQGDMYRVDEIRRGFIPGTMQLVGGIGSETAARTGQGGAENGLGGVTSIEGAIMDAFGTVHTGQRDDSGHMMASASQAQALREKEFRSMARQAGVDISGLRGADFVNAAVAYKQHVDGVMRSDPSHGGFFHKTSNLTAAQNTSALENRRSTAIDFLKDKYGITTTPTTTDDGGAPPPSPPAAPSTTVTPTAGDPGDSSNGGGTQYSVNNYAPGTGDSGGSYTAYEPGGESDYSGNSYSIGTGGGVGERFGPTGGFVKGGRVGMQAGGVAQQPQPAGFVGGPPENFTDGQTVADDQPMTVREGTFVINAAAVEFAGSDDIKKMLSDAYAKMQKKVDKTIAVAKIPTEDEIDVAVSRGEVIVPPEIAKIIGYDRLEKINNRGKKEVSRRQNAAEGGFLEAGGYAEGGDVGEDIPMQESIALDDSTRQKFSTFLKSRRQRGDVEKLIDSLDDRERLFVLGLVETTAAKDSVDSMMGVMQTAINRANTNRPSFKNVNDLSSVMKQRSSRGSGSRMFQYDGLEPSKITPRLREVVQGRVPNAVTKLFMAAENISNPETEGQRPLPFDVMFYTKPDAPLAKDFEKNPKMRYHSSFGGHDYYALDAAPEN